MKLFEINAALEELLNQQDPETGELTCDLDQLDALMMERDAKLEGLALYVKNADALLREVDDMWRRADENERFREAEVLGWLHQLIQSADTVEDVEMSDEELASLLQPICPPIPHCPDEPPHNCRKCVFNWLRQEATP